MLKSSLTKIDPSPNYLERLVEWPLSIEVSLPWLLLAAGIAVAAVLIWQKIRKKVCVILYASPDLPPMVYKVQRGRLLNLPTPVREGYTFLGWETPDGRPYKARKIFLDCCFVAKWEKNQNN